ncbi:hypothetical protein B0H16DRAFT_977244 [Mycena metata]|uniref:Uncharacterized protein n=1 Tax=Mycena metata TaxID=1033252 RepID=A0AAD7IMM6_9AGAR|nr:hypothetical protein B0H16DRAFT_977244 [Mycena metata]
MSLVALYLHVASLTSSALSSPSPQVPQASKSRLFLDSKPLAQHGCFSKPRDSSTHLPCPPWCPGRFCLSPCLYPHLKPSLPSKSQEPQGLKFEDFALSMSSLNALQIWRRVSSSALQTPNFQVVFRERDSQTLQVHGVERYSRVNSGPLLTMRLSRRVSKSSTVFVKSSSLNLSSVCEASQCDG